MKATRCIVAALALTLGIALTSDARAQEPAPATAAQERHEQLMAQQSLDRLRQAEKNLQLAIEQLQQDPKPSDAAQPSPGGIAQSAAMQQAEQAMNDVRRAIDEIKIASAQRQSLLDRLDDADSALRMARKPDAKDERKQLQMALRDVQKEVSAAREAVPAKAGDR